MANIQEILEKERKKATAPPALPEEQDLPLDLATNGKADVNAGLEGLSRIAGITVEAVVGGALQTITFRDGTNPAMVKTYLSALDGNVKVRDEFPKRGFGGQREVKVARAMALIMRITDSGKFIDLVCQNGEDLKVSVSKSKSDTFQSDLKALGKIGEAKLTKVGAAFEQKKEATIILDESEQFGVRYWSTDDGKHFLDSMNADAPEDGGKGEDKS